MGWTFWFAPQFAGKLSGKLAGKAGKLHWLQAEEEVSMSMLIDPQHESSKRIGKTIRPDVYHVDQASNKPFGLTL